MERGSSAHLRGRAYRCLHCQRKVKTEVNSKQRIEDHVYKYHIPNDEQPFWCRLCLFRCRSADLLRAHVTTYTRHRNVMLEKGIINSDKYLVSNKYPYVVGESDIQVMSKADSMSWWLFRSEGGSQSEDIVERAAREAQIDRTLTEDPLDLSVGENQETETEKAVVDLRVILENEFGKGKNSGPEEPNETDNEIYTARPLYLEQPLDLRVVKKVTLEEKDELLEGQPLDMSVDSKEEVTGEEVDSEKGGDVEEKEKQTDSACVEGEEKEQEGENADLGGPVTNAKKRQRDGRHGDKATKRVRHTLKSYRSRSVSSSSSSSESESSDSDASRSSSSRREKRFTDILSEMIRKTGNIVGQQVIANAELINKLQTTVDKLREEVAELRHEKKILSESESKTARTEDKENRQDLRDRVETQEKTQERDRPRTNKQGEGRRRHNNGQTEKPRHFTGKKYKGYNRSSHSSYRRDGHFRAHNGWGVRN